MGADLFFKGTRNKDQGERAEIPKTDGGLRLKVGGK
jgi:hypothetical protein